MPPRRDRLKKKGSKQSRKRLSQTEEEEEEEQQRHGGDGVATAAQAGGSSSVAPRQGRHKAQKVSRKSRLPRGATTTDQEMEVSGDEEALDYEDPELDVSSEGEVAEEDYEVEENGRQAEEELERMMQEMDVRTVAWTRSQGMEEGQELDFDNQAYDMFHRLQTEWPALSFDHIRDNLGEQRFKFPMKGYLVAGSQAEGRDQNKLYLMRYSRLHRTKYDTDSENDSEDDESLDEDPIVDYRTSMHPGCVNRVRSMPQHPSIIATWSDSGHVYAWNFDDKLSSFEGPVSSMQKNVEPMFCQDHPCEGYALDWSHTVEGNLVVGNCRGDISVWQAAEAGFIVKAERWQHPCRGGASVEDIQWSPTEPEVFACAATDGTVAFWDVRQSNCALQLQAHDADVNVLSWNRTVDHMLASGGDDGIVAVWDLRMLQQGHRAPFSRFQYHQGPITSVDWNPHEGFELASCSEDNQLVIWDVSVEADEDSVQATQLAGEELEDLPMQMIFLHEGQTDVKEVRWHPQLVGVLASTAATGFHIFRPSYQQEEGGAPLE